MSDVSGWQAHQLVEFLTKLAESTEEAAAVEDAAYWAAEAFATEVAAIVRDGELVTVLGFHQGEIPVAELLAIATGHESSVKLPLLGTCTVLISPWDTNGSGRIVLARVGADQYSSDERGLLVGVARALTVTVRMLRLLREERTLSASLAERKTLLERLSRIQRSIAGRAPLQQTLDAIVAGVRDVLEDDIVVLHRLDEEHPGFMNAIAITGADSVAMEALRLLQDSEGACGLAIKREDVVVMEDYAHASDRGAIKAFVDRNLQAAMAAPVRESGRVVGSLGVASFRDGRTYTETEQEVLTTFAEHVSIALTDAQTLRAVRQALHDPLTGLPSRTLLLDRLEYALSRCQRDGSRVAVIFLDLDRFKLINDTLGHAAGDDMLIRVGGIIRRTIRASDTVGRIGGDEFAIVLEDVNAHYDVVIMVERILSGLREPLHINGVVVHPAGTIGVAISGNGTETAETLLRDADMAMYCGKQDARGDYMIYSPTMRQDRADRIALEADLRLALERHEFTLVYQPIMDLSQPQMIGVEALIRWQQPTRGNVPPLTFIPIAEECGLIVKIGVWVLRETCRQMAMWNAHCGRRLAMVSVNVSPRQLLDPTFIADVAAILRETGIDPRSLVLEITETAVLKNTERIIQTLIDLRALGVRIALDDFGTGYSSLTHLLRLPLDVVKIDKTFIDDVVVSTTSRALAHAIIALGRALDIIIIAEGIEDLDQVELLSSLECPFGQGYHFARPLRPIDIEAGLLEGARVVGARTETNRGP